MLYPQSISQMSATSIDYILGGRLGINGDSYVYNATDSLSQQVVAKVRDMSDPATVERTMQQHNNETQALSRLAAHPNVVRLITSSQSSLFHEAQTPKRAAYIVYEKVIGHELIEYVSASAFPEPIAKYFFLQMLTGLKFIHKNGISHRQISLFDIMIEDVTNRVKIVGFSFANVQAKNSDRSSEEMLQNDYMGHQGFMAPELLQQKPYRGQEVDLFAMAVTLFSLIFGDLPFRTNDPNEDKYYKALINRPEQFFQYHYERAQIRVSPEFCDLIAKMLQPEPSDRLSLDQVLSHSWFKSNIATDEQVEEQMQVRRMVAQTAERQRIANNSVPTATFGRYLTQF